MSATLRVDLAGLLGNAARTIRQPDEVYGEMTAFGLEEVAKHIEMVCKGEATLAEFCECYRLPAPENAAPDADAGRVAELDEALRLILPMAKGWAYEHPVGSNQRYVEHAESLLAPAQDEPQASPPDAGRVETRDLTDKATAWDAIAEKNAQLAAIRAEIPAEMLLAHKDDAAAAVRALVERIGSAVDALTSAGSYRDQIARALTELRGNIDG